MIFFHLLYSIKEEKDFEFELVTMIRKLLLTMCFISRYQKMNTIEIFITEIQNEYYVYVCGISQNTY